jgi:hypothetical protein
VREGAINKVFDSEMFDSNLKSISVTGAAKATRATGRI